MLTNGTLLGLKMTSLWVGLHTSQYYWHWTMNLHKNLANVTTTLHWMKDLRDHSIKETGGMALLTKKIWFEWGYIFVQLTAWCRECSRIIFCIYVLMNLLIPLSFNVFCYLYPNCNLSVFFSVSPSGQTDRDMQHISPDSHYLLIFRLTAWQKQSASTSLCNYPGMIITELRDVTTLNTALHRI